MFRFVLLRAAAVSLVICFAPNVLAGDDPWADIMVDYVQGSSPGPAAGYTNPSVALGSPERITGEGAFPNVVSPFSPPFLNTEIVSIGAGGSLTLQFNTPVTDDPANPFGIDLIVFGNAGFIDVGFPGGIAGGLFGADGGQIHVSADGKNWMAIPGSSADGLYPALGYLDSGPYDARAGRVESNFTQPVNPTLLLSDFTGLNHEQIVALYGGSGGGFGIDLASVGLSAINLIRIVNPAGSGVNVEIDAVSDVSPDSRSADLNGDGVVNGLDLGILLANWSIPAGSPGCGGMTGGCASDLNGDVVVDGIDLGILLSEWTL